MSTVERRYTPVPVELRASKDRRSIGGYAAVFNKESKNLGGFVERLDPEVFNASRGDGWPDVLARYNHDNNMLLGTTDAGTLRLSVDGTGLVYEVDPPQSRGDILELVERGDVRKSSFAFRTIDDDWDSTDQGFPRRTLIKAQLVDVAPVNVPAYVDTTAGLRSLAEKMDAEIEEVRQLAESNELHKFFVRTDNTGRPKPKPTTLGAAARMELLNRATDPYSG